MQCKAVVGFLTFLLFFHSIPTSPLSSTNPATSALTATFGMMSSKQALLEYAHDNSFNHSLFIVNEGTEKHDNVDIYLRTASLNAILNADGRADEVRCYPGTREEVIGKVERWMNGQSEPDRRILWLNGHAGAGKSAIAQTVAENGAERGVDAADFFFFGADDTRNHARPLVSTLVYQLVKVYPGLREHLTDALKAQPLASTASVKEQFAQLLASPIEKIRRSSGVNRDVILIIDGLDECKDEVEQRQILGALHDLVRKPGSPFRVMVASRVEPHIVMFFNKIAHSVESLSLNDDYQPEADIRKFVIAKFDEIKGTHNLARTLGEHWPTQTDINKIVSKSSGQFIYAATVMRFMEYSNDSPAVSLLTIHELQPPTAHSPFAQLDALYSHVFLKARDIRPVQWAIGFHFLALEDTGAVMLDIAGYKPIELESLFADISAIARVSLSNGPKVDVQFYHASLRDYLKNKSRSGIYHVDAQVILADACAIGFSKFHDKTSLHVISKTFFEVEQPTTELTESLLAASKRRLDHNFGHSPTFWMVLTRIIVLYFRTDKALCRRILCGWTRFAYIHKLDVKVRKITVGQTAYLYFQMIKLTEKAKFIISHAFTRDEC